tara:strand:+ start:1517 stop:1840 length:324 start_codon:yes stop_codon:yes gene_type:complete
MASVEEILMAKAMADARDKPDPAVAMGTGASIGAAAGLLGGGKGRLAGGLMGAILGGGLGLGVRNMMIQESPAAAMLAKMQAQSGLDVMDRKQLEYVLRNAYNEGVL